MWGGKDMRTVLNHLRVREHRWREGCEVSVDRGKDSGMSSEVEEVVGGDVVYWEHKQRPRGCLVVEESAPSSKGFSSDASASISSSTVNTGVSPPRALQRGNLSTVCRPAL